MSTKPETESKPFVSIVMPAYNAGAFIGEVIATIIGQSFKDFEFVIIDDGSTDNTSDVIKSYAKIDNRVKYHYQENQGSKKLGETINKGISLSKGTWIARADADDPWYLDKLERQVAFIKSHPDCVLLGGGADIINERGEFMYHLLGPLGAEDNKRAMTLYTTIAHGSAMFRRSVFDTAGGYRNIHAVEDLDLWQRISLLGNVYNLPEPLFKYRQNTQGISMSNQDHQSKEVEKIGIAFFKQSPPELLLRRDIRARLNVINALRDKSIIPNVLVDWLIVRYIEDNIRISRLHFKHGVKKTGFKQLFNIATSGRVGLKQSIKFVIHKFKFEVSRSWKKAV